MTTPVQQPQPSAQTARMLHGAMGLGLILFLVVAQFVLVPKATVGLAPPSLITGALGISLVLCAVSILLSTRVPRPTNGESGAAYWKRAGQKALISWALLEGAGLLAVVVYSQTASRAALVVAIVAIVIFWLVNPGYFERR